MESYQRSSSDKATQDATEHEAAQLLEASNMTTAATSEIDKTIRHQVELLEYGRTRRSSFAFVDLGIPEEHYAHDDVLEVVEEEGFAKIDEEAPLYPPSRGSSVRLGHQFQGKSGLRDYVEQIPAILVTCILILMAAVPFGVAYFPIGWTNDPSVSPSNTGGDDDEMPVYGTFPFPGKEALGIRMCLFTTLLGQIVMTYASQFENPVAFQIMENVPFYHSIARIVIAEQGYGKDALATLFFLFGLSSVLVGAVFYSLGRANLGRITYYFPAHVLVGCIGGIGVYIALSSIAVTNNKDFTFDMDGIREFVDDFHLYGLVVFFEVTLRLLLWATHDETGRPRYRFLAPIFFCSIVPIFYLGLYWFGISIEEAGEMGYMFPDAASQCDETTVQCAAPSFQEKVFDGHVFDMFRAFDFRLIDWHVAWNAMGDVLALVSFSLIHVPINIPAFAVSSNISGDVDINKELMAHGYSNALAGIFGGLQNVMTYSFSVLFMKSGGRGVASSLTIAAITALMFVYGPAVAMMFPRCMAGTLLLHIGVDLFLEGVLDSLGKFDRFEYCGIWFITLSMTLHGMTAALLAGLIVALSTFALQSMTNLDPIFRVISAATLRSSAWNRSAEASKILDDKIRGRSRILVVSLQGHLFFGNVADLTDSLKGTLRNLQRSDQSPFILLLDFTLVVGMDSSAAHAIAKLKDVIHRSYSVEVTIFVTGKHREGFPCAYALSEALTVEDTHETIDFNDVQVNSPKPARARRGSISVTPGSKAMKASQALRAFAKNHVFDDLDAALMLAEDFLVARERPSLLKRSTQDFLEHLDDEHLGEEEEKRLAVRCFENLVPDGKAFETQRAIELLLSKMTREEYAEGSILWKHGEDSDCAKLLVYGALIATVDGTDVREKVKQGTLLGELGLIEGFRRLTNVSCTSEKAIVYSISRREWDEIVKKKPEVARIIDRIAIRYLAQRVQHVSNRIFETRCLPV